MKKTLLISLMLGIGSIAIAQTSKIDTSKYPKPVTFTNEQDHANMQEQLGIKVLRPGPSGNESAPNAANYDESKANPCPELPDILTTNAGQKITSEEMWWTTRRPELVEALEREVYGKLPDNIPDVNWEVKITDREFVARTPVIAKQIIGHVDNSEYPLITVDINMILVVPANAKGPVPVWSTFFSGTSPTKWRRYGDLE